MCSITNPKPGEPVRFDVDGKTHGGHISVVYSHIRMAAKRKALDGIRSTTAKPAVPQRAPDQQQSLPS